MPLSPEEEYLRRRSQTPEEQHLDRFRSPEEQYLNRGDVRANRAIAPQSVYDVTLGALQYGAADTAGLLARGLPGIGDTEPLVKFSQTMQQFKDTHPEYGPTEVNSAWDLARNPNALSSRVFGAAPQMIATMMTMEYLPYGTALAAGLSTAIESRRNYESAIAYGANEEEAVSAGRRAGLVNGIFEVLQSRRLLNFAEGRQGLLAARISGRAESMMRAVKLPPDAVGAVVSAATYNALQGAATDGIANLTYGRDIKEGFFDRRLQESITGAVTAGLIGPMKKYLTVPVTDPTGKVRPVELNAFDRDSFRQFLIEEKGMDVEPAHQFAEITDAFARNWAGRNNQPVEAFYGKFVNGPDKSTGDNMLPSVEPLAKIFHEKDPRKIISNFGDLAQSIMSPPDKQALADAGLNTPKQVNDAFTRYLTEGIPPSPELVEPFEFVKDTMKDVYRTSRAQADSVIKEYEETRADYKVISAERYPVETKGPIRSFAGRKAGDKIEIAKFHEDFGPGIPYPERDLFLMNEPTELGRGEKRLVEASQGKYLTPADLAKGIEKEKYDEAVAVRAGIASPIPSNVRAAFDRVLSIDTDQIGEARRRLYSSEQNLLNLKRGDGPEKVAFAASKYQRTGEVFKGEHHGESTGEAYKVLGKPEGTTLPLEALLEQGFLTNKGRFVSREEAAKIAKQTGTSKMEGDGGAMGFMRASENIDLTKQINKIDPIGAPEPGNLFRMGKTELELQDETVKAMHEDLRRLQLSRDLPDRDSAVARRAAFQASIRESLRLETPAQRVVRTGYERFGDWFGSLVDFSAPLKRYQWGRKTLDMLSDVLGHQHSIEGEFYESNWKAYHALTRQDRQWLSTVNEDEAATSGVRLDNFTRFIEAVGVPNPIDKAPNQSLHLYREQVRKIMVDLGGRAEREGVVVKLGEGDLIPYRQPKELRMLRFLTDDARVALEERRGEVFDAIKKVVKEQAKKRGDDATVAGLDKALADYATGLGIRESGPLTDARTLPVMPTEVMTASGKLVKVLHTEPFTFLNKAVRTQAYQLGWHRVIGSDEIAKVESKNMKKFLEQAGFEPAYNMGVLKQRFADKGFVVPEHLDNLSQLETFAKELNKGSEEGTKIKVGPTRKDYALAVEKLTVDDIKPNNIGAWRSFAEDIGGISKDASPAELVNEIKARVREKPIDAVDALKKGIVKEGGDVKRLVNTIRLSQGIPIYRTHSGFLERDPLVRGSKLVSGILGSLQTSMSVIANIPQTLVQVPQFVGLGRYLDAVDAVMKDRRGTEQALLAMGAIGDTHMAWGLERGYMMEGISRNVRQAAQYGTGMKFISDINNIVAGESFRRMALDWQKEPSKFGDSDARLAKQLRLNDQQIAEIRQGKMSDLSFSKIVQNGVAVTQFVTESAHRRGVLENHPVLRMVFAYNSYATGTARATGDFYRSWKDAIKSGSSDAVLNMANRSAVLLAGSLGAGVAGEMLRNVIRGDVAREQKRDWLEQGIGALTSIQLFGPTQRLFESMQYAKGSPQNWAIGLMPQVRAVADLVALGYNAAMVTAGSEDRMGANAGFDLWTQAGRLAAAHTPLAKSAMRWREQVAYPNTPLYAEVRANVDTWRGEVAPKKKYLGEGTVNPDYEKVWRWVVRGDKEMAMKSAQEYYEKSRREFAEDPEASIARGITLDRARTGLHASLQARSPISLNPQLFYKYVNQLPPVKREQYLRVQRDYLRLMNSVAPPNF